MECPVCFEDKNNFIWFGCSHCVCKTCFDQMVLFHHDECPFCRHKLPHRTIAQPARIELYSLDDVQTMCCATSFLGGMLACIYFTMSQGH
jgi:hypothetical protein